VVSFLDLERRPVAVFVVRGTFFETGLLTGALRAGRALLAEGLFAELFFLVGFAIAEHFLNRQGRENGRLIKNISRMAQADSIKKVHPRRGNASIPRENY